MDLAGGMLATEIARGRIATVAVEAMTFHQPVKVGDAVCVHGECMRIGNTSITIKLEVWIKPLLRSECFDRHCVTEAVFTYVAIDDTGRPRLVPKD
jgi:acyl-CoA thioesterase YciA